MKKTMRATKGALLFLAEAFRIRRIRGLAGLARLVRERIRASRGLWPGRVWPVKRKVRLKIKNKR